MTTVRHWGAAAATTPFPPLERRSIAVNTFTRQIAVGDESASQVGTPLPMIAVRYFDPRAPYALNDIVVQGGIIYKAKGLISPGAFNATQWTAIDNTSLGAAAPFDALAYNGMQINGSMEVSQEYGIGVTVTGAAKYLCDGYQLIYGGTMVLGGGSFVNPVINGLPNLLTCTTPTAQPSMGAGDFAIIRASIEGYRVSRLTWGSGGSQPITVAFWSVHHRPGVYSLRVGNGASDRSYTTTYTHAVADAQQFNVITIPGCTDGTWNKTATAGLLIDFTIASGTTYVAPTANVWASANYFAAPGQVNAVAAISDAFRITGVIVLPGIQVPTAAQSPLIMRPYGEELVMCQRYWESIRGGYRMNMGAAGALAISVPFSVIKRAVPTLAYQGAGPTVANSTFLTFPSPSINEVLAIFNGTANTDSYNYGYIITVDARL